jgi:hypothetical protein
MISMKLEVIAGALMVFVGLGVAALAKWKWQIQMRWLWCGALLWAVAVGEKLLLGVTINPAVFGALRHLPNSLYLTLGSCYGGLISGVTEVGMTLVAGLLWRWLADDARRAVGIGLGAGAFEAICFGLMMMAGNEFMTLNQAGFGVSAFIPPVERLIVIPCHVAVRSMTFYAVATGRWSWFWGGFVLFSALDGIYILRHLNHTFHTTNPWWIELSPIHLAFPIISVLLVRYLWRHWPPTRHSSFSAV